jgi:hypothetical protein
MHQLMHKISTIRAPVALGVSLFFMFAGEYRLSLAALVLVVLCMEMRVRLGYRLPRGSMFWSHIAFAVPLFCALAMLGFYTQSTWLAVLAPVLFAGLLVTGGALFYKEVTR